MKVSAPGNHKPPAQAPEPGRGSTGRPSLLTFVLTNPEKSGIIIGSGALAAPIPQPKGGTALIMGQKKKVLSIGEIIWDVYPNEQCIGGAPLNFAAHCAACGCESWLLSAVGADPRGAEALERARKFGIRTDWIQSLPDKLTGQVHPTSNRQAPLKLRGLVFSMRRCPIPQRQAEQHQAQLCCMFPATGHTAATPYCRLPTAKSRDCSF